MPLSGRRGFGKAKGRFLKLKGVQIRGGVGAGLPNLARGFFQQFADGRFVVEFDEDGKRRVAVDPFQKDCPPAAKEMEQAEIRGQSEGFGIFCGFVPDGGGFDGSVCVLRRKVRRKLHGLHAVRLALPVPGRGGLRRV